MFLKDEDKEALAKHIEAWLTEKGKLADSKTLKVSLSVVPSPRVYVKIDYESVMTMTVAEFAERFNFRTLLRNRLNHANCFFVGQLVRQGEQLDRYRSIGPKSLREIKKALKELGLVFGAKVPISEAERAVAYNIELGQVYSEHVWTLQKCGLVTLGDLAKSTKDELKTAFSGDDSDFEELYSEALSLLKWFGLEHA